jgi:hypothetical protein
MIRGDCYALEYRELYNEVKRCGKARHVLLLESSIASLWHEKTTKPVLIGYIPGNVILLFVLTR